MAWVWYIRASELIGFLTFMWTLPTSCCPVIPGSHTSSYILVISFWIWLLNLIKSLVLILKSPYDTYLSHHSQILISVSCNGSQSSALSFLVVWVVTPHNQVPWVQLMAPLLLYINTSSQIIYYQTLIHDRTHSLTGI